MPRFFNITGPCRPDRHYMLPAEARLPTLDRFIAEELYFVVHAARQTGKTTAMRSMAARLRAKGMAAVVATLETSQGATAVGEAEPRWLSAIAWSAENQLPVGQRPPPPVSIDGHAEGGRLAAWLSAWCRALHPVPLVLLLDEADVVTGPAMVNLLRQLRSGFFDRPEAFPASVVLIGMRDLRDYLVSAKDGTPVNPGSPFNIKAASLTLRNFTRDEVASLYGQHTADTGQVFTPEAVDRAFHWSQGQPFLVNALARTVVMEEIPDPATPVTVAHVDGARDRLVLARTTHLDSLAQRLREPRLAPILRAILLGDEHWNIRYDSDDFQYAVDLGLVRRGASGAEVMNPLYREVLARQLSLQAEAMIPPAWWPWRRPDGGLDFDALVTAFVGWWRQNADMLVLHEDEPYKEAAAHLAFMGFLQRLVNGGGSVEREYAAGRGRVDLVAHWGGERFVAELKRVPPGRRSLAEVRKEGIAQLAGYLDTLGLAEGWLLVFDQTPGRTWKQRCWRREVRVGDKRLHLRGA